MKDYKDNWERLINMVNEDLEINPDLAKNAIQTINLKEESKVTDGLSFGLSSNSSLGSVKVKKRFGALSIVLALAITAVVALGIFLPIFFLNKGSITYYNEDQLVYETVDNINAFIEQSEETCYYFNELTTITNVATVIETGELALIEQESLFITETGFDKVNIIVVTLPNSEFDFYRYYEAIENAVISEINVEYDSLVYEGNNVIRAKFDIDEYSYYLEISTLDEVEGKLETYINELMN